MSMPKSIKDEAQYKITIQRPIARGRHVLSPRQKEIIVKGKVLKDIKADVLTAELVNPVRLPLPDKAVSGGKG